MRSRIVGLVAVVLGILGLVTIFAGSKDPGLAPLLGSIAFIALGGYYLFTGRKAATLKEYVLEGKLGHDELEKKP